MVEPIKSKIEGQRILVLCDTTEYNLNSHKGRITDFNYIGSTANNEILGFFSHNQLVLHRQTKETIGWANVTLFNRAVDNKPFVRPNYSLAITEKESNKWYEPSIYSRDEVLNTSNHCMYVMDREGDIFEVISSLPTESCDVLVRAKHDRIVYTKQGQRTKLKTGIGKCSVKGIVNLEINGESRKRKKRKAKCELRYAQFTIPQPKNIIDKENYLDSLELTCLQIKEVSKTPKGETPIQWTLWTSEKIKSNKQANELLKCYASRWAIEEAHRLLKKKGLNIESSELESGKSIRKLLILGMEASIKVMKLKSARDGGTQIEIVELFEENQIEFLEILNQNLQGSTKPLRNPYPKDKLSWASWIIARLGGWKGYSSQRPPGTITFKRGLDKFNQKYDGFLLAKQI